MNRRAVFYLVLLLLAAGIVATLLIFRSTPHISGPIRHEVYVWQSAWTQPVRDAVSQHATNFSEIVPLKAEISWKDKKPQLTRVTVDYSTLAAISNGRAELPLSQDAQQRVPTIGLALRIASYPGPFATNDAAAKFITERQIHWAFRRRSATELADPAKRDATSRSFLESTGTLGTRWRLDGAPSGGDARGDLVSVADDCG